MIIDCASSYTKLENSDLYSILGLERKLIHLMRWCVPPGAHFAEDLHFRKITFPDVLVRVRKVVCVVSAAFG